jgi:hypothetical protein
LPKLHEAVLEEILEERVPWRPGRRYPRAVKRKLSHYPTLSRAKPEAKQRKPRGYRVQVAARSVGG